MLALRTAVLEHTEAHGVHHDWLIEDPALPDPRAPHARLWTARLLPPPGLWIGLGRFELHVIAPHRRVYLQHQGPIANDRGRVRRLAEGRCLARLWSRDRMVLDVGLNGVECRMQMRRLTGDRWLAVIGA